MSPVQGMQEEEQEAREHTEEENNPTLIPSC